MPEQLGKIERPELERFKGKKKLYLVPLLYTSEDAPDEYKEKCDRYWRQATEQLTNLVAKVGKVDRIYHESIVQPGEDGMKAMERLNQSSYQIAKTQCDNGAVFETIEEGELLEEVTDWQRCLMLGFASKKVANEVSQFYVEAARKRKEFIGKRIGETLKGDEAGLLFIAEGHSVQFPADVEVFSIFPPALDEIHRWLRDRALMKFEKATEDAQENIEESTETVEEKDSKGAENEGGA